MKQYEKAVNSQYQNCCRADAKRQIENNRIIREALNESGMRYWQLADLMCIRPETLSRKLRYELPVTEQKAIVELIRKEG